MKTVKTNILGDSISLECSKPTLRTDGKTQRALWAFVAHKLLDPQADYAVNFSPETQFASRVGRLVNIEILTPDQTDDLDDVAAFIAAWRSLDWNNAASILACYNAYMDLHIDIIDAWEKVDKAVNRDVVVARREQLPVSELNTQEQAALKSEDSPLAPSAKSTAP